MVIWPIFIIFQPVCPSIDAIFHQFFKLFPLFQRYGFIGLPADNIMQFALSGNNLVKQGISANGGLFPFYSIRPNPIRSRLIAFRHICNRQGLFGISCCCRCRCRSGFFWCCGCGCGCASSAAGCSSSTAGCCCPSSCCNACCGRCLFRFNHWENRIFRQCYGFCWKCILPLHQKALQCRKVCCI